MRKPDPLEQSQLGIDPGTQASTPVDATTVTTQETIANRRAAQMAARPQQVAAPTTAIAQPVSMGAIRGPSDGTRTNALGQTFDQSGRMVSMPNTGRWGAQTAADVAPQQPMQGGEFAAARAARAPIQGMQGTTPASERIESQKNVYERMREGDEQSRMRALEQFEALPPDAQRAQIARATANLVNYNADKQVENPQLEAQRAFNQQPGAQPQYQPGQVIGSGTYGAVVVGAQGAQMPFVQDPMNPQAGAIPVSSGMSRDQYVANLSPQQRQSARQMVMEQGGPVADQLRQIDRARSEMMTSPAMRGRDGAPRSYVGQQEQMLQRQEDDLIYGAMRDPGAMVSARQRSAEQRQREEVAMQRESQVERERALKEEQKFYSGIWKQAEADARRELMQGDYAVPTEQQIMARADQKFREATGRSVAQVSQGANIGAGPGAGMMQAPPSQSGAPDFSAQEVFIDPASPVEFQMTPQGKLFVTLPDGEIMAGFNMQGKAVAFPQNPAEEAMLPPGTEYVTPGAVARNQPQIKVKAGEAPGMSAAARVEPAVERQRIGEAAARRAKGREEPIRAYEQELDEYNRLQVDARQMAVEAFNRQYGEGLLKVDAAGNPDFNSLSLRDRFQPGRSNIDARGAFQNEVNKAAIALAQERYQDGKVPSWVDRTGTQITGISKPRQPEGFREGMQAGQVLPEDMAAAEQEYYGSVGALKENVQAERLISEGTRAWRAPMMRNGRMSISYKGQQIPAVRVRAGNVSTTLPRPETAEQAIMLMRDQKPFAIEQAGRAMPYKFDVSDPLIQQVFDPNVPKEISPRLGSAQANPGAVAAKEWAYRTFGYLPVNVRKSIAEAILADAGYRLTG